MARYKCPSCGQPYNGKVCRSCLYETFSNETSCDVHHKEVIFDETPPVRTLPKVQTRQTAYTRPQAKKKPSKIGTILRTVLILYIIVLLLNTAFGAVASFREVTSSFAVVEPEPEVTFPTGGTVLYEGDGLLVKTDWEDGAAYDGDISVYAQNSTNQDLTVSAQKITVNGYLVDTSYMYCDVPADSTGIGRLRLDEEALADAGIETVAEITFYLTIYNPDSYEAIAETDTITFSAGVPDGFTQPVDDSGTRLLDQDGIRIVCKGYKADPNYPDDVCEGVIQFYVENNTDRCLQIYTPEVLVNQEYADLTLWCELQPGTRTITDMYLYGLEDLNIRSIGDIAVLELTLEVNDRDDYGFSVKTDTLYLDITE